MELVSSDFKSIVEDMRAKVAAAKDPNQTMGTVRADAKLLGQQYQEVKCSRDMHHSTDLNLTL